MFCIAAYLTLSVTLDETQLIVRPTLLEPSAPVLSGLMAAFNWIRRRTQSKPLQIGPLSFLPTAGTFRCMIWVIVCYSVLLWFLCVPSKATIKQLGLPWFYLFFFTNYLFPFSENRNVLTVNKNQKIANFAESLRLCNKHFGKMKSACVSFVLSIKLQMVQLLLYLQKQLY